MKNVRSRKNSYGKFSCAIIRMQIFIGSTVCLKKYVRKRSSYEKSTYAKVHMLMFLWYRIRLQKHPKIIQNINNIRSRKNSHVKFSCAIIRMQIFIGNIRIYVYEELLTNICNTNVCYSNFYGNEYFSNDHLSSTTIFANEFYDIRTSAYQLLRK